MLFKKILMVLALALCNSESIYAFPPQTFNQNDMKHPFVYNSVHYYTSKKPELDLTYEPEESLKSRQTDYNERDQFGYRSIQYAPLALRSENQASNENEENKEMETAGTDIVLSHPVANKSFIEPRLEFKQKSSGELRTSVIYGHNIHVPQLSNISPAHNLVQKQITDFTTKDSVNQAGYAKPLMYYYETKYQTEQTPRDVDNAVNNQRLADPTMSEHLYPVLTRQYTNNAESLINERVLHEKESPLIQPQLIYARPYRLHLNIARAYSNVHVPLKNMFINKIFPPCKNLDQLESSHLHLPSNKQTKLYAIRNNCIPVHRRL